MNIYEMYGRAAEALEAETRAHLETVGLLRRIRTGEVGIEDFGVTDKKWFLVEKPQEEEAADGDSD